MIKFILFLSLFLIFGCEDKEDTISETEALLRWTGEFAVDGCGFFIDINNHEYKPEDETAISDSFKIIGVGGVDVFIRYELLKTKIEYYCGMLPQLSKTDGLKLISISKR